MATLEARHDSWSKNRTHQGTSWHWHPYKTTNTNILSCLKNENYLSWRYLNHLSLYFSNLRKSLENFKCTIYLIFFIHQCITNSRFLSGTGNSVTIKLSWWDCGWPCNTSFGNTSLGKKFTITDKQNLYWLSKWGRVKWFADSVNYAINQTHIVVLHSYRQ